MREFYEIQGSAAPQKIRGRSREVLRKNPADKILFVGVKCQDQNSSLYTPERLQEIPFYFETLKYAMFVALLKTLAGVSRRFLIVDIRAEWGVGSEPPQATSYQEHPH